MNYYETIKAIRDGLEHLSKKELIRGSLLNRPRQYDEIGNLVQVEEAGVCAVGAGRLCALFPEGVPSIDAIIDDPELQKRFGKHLDFDRAAMQDVVGVNDGFYSNDRAARWQKVYNWLTTILERAGQ